jgi:hypothetical protein
MRRLTRKREIKMSTRSTTHFVDEGRTIAIVYRHSDGYPSGAGRDINSFLKQCKALPDGRLNDGCYLAAKYVVFLASMFNNSFKRDEVTRELKQVQNESKLDFLSVGILLEDAGDIEYRYVIDCGKTGKNGLPEVKCFQVSCDINNENWTATEVKIPRGKNNWL